VQKSDVQKAKRGFASCAAKGVIAGLVVIFAALAVFAALVSSGRVPESAMNMMTWAAAFLGAAVGAVIASKTFGARALVISIAVSAVLFTLTLLGAAFSEEGGLIGPMTPGLLLALLGGGVLGGFISPRKRAQKSKKRASGGKLF